jgi:hypothetical protein
LVPKDVLENLAFRRNLYVATRKNPRNQRRFRRMCAADPLWYFNTCLWTYSPHDDDECTKLPFITYDYQDELILKIIDHAHRKKPLNVKKARDMGVSWTVLGVGRWLTKFRPDYAMGVMSRKKDLVDQNGSMDSLMQKLDYMYDNEFPWLQERRTRNDMIYHDLESDGKIRGETANPDAFRAGRQRLVLWDEAAVTPDAFNIAAGMGAAAGCVVRVYTPHGSNSEPASLERAGVETVKLDWRQNPLHRRGEYQVVRGRAVPVDTAWHERNPGYAFVTSGPTVRDGMFRSPWYDDNCRVLHNIPLLIAQELEMDDALSSSHFFDEDFLRRIEDETCRPPRWVGRLEFCRATCNPQQLVPAENGDFKLWQHLPFGRPLENRTYTVSCDISQGMGASNSTLVVTDDKLQEKIAEWAGPYMMPHDFARLAVATCRFFHDAAGTPALLAWESNGPGQVFGKCVMDQGFENVWYEPGERTVPGWSSTSEKKLLLLGAYKAAQMDHQYLERSFECVHEQRNYVIVADGTISYVDSRGLVDPSGAKDNHGDRVIATALGHHVSKTRRTAAKEQEAEFQNGSRGWFNQQREEKLNRDRRPKRRIWTRHRVKQ